MKKQLTQSYIIKSIDEVGFRQTEEMVKDYPELKAENVELKLKLERSEAENQELRIADQKQLISALEQVNALQQQLIESKNENIKLKDQIIELQAKFIEPSTEEKYQDEEKEYSKSCLGLE